MVRANEIQEQWHMPITDGDRFLPVDQAITYHELFDMYAHSAIGQHHAAQDLRWNQYGVSNTGLTTAIGADAHPLNHMILTHNLALKVAARENEDMSHLQLTDREQAVVRTAMLLHDMGENTHPDFANTCGVVGDVPFGLKTEAQRETEATIRRTIWEHKYGFFLPEDFRAEVESVIDHTGNERAVKTAQAAHTLGAFQAAAHALTASEADTTLSREDRAALRELAIDATRQLARTALPEAMEFSHVNERVAEMAPDLEQAAGIKIGQEKEVRIMRVNINSKI